MLALRRYLGLTADGRQPLLIIWVMAAIVICLTALAAFSMEMLSTARAYVGGESRWSKAQKEAIYQLVRYAKSRDEADFRKYRAAIAVTLGDRQVRIELEKPDPDLNLVYQGFLQGGNHPEDFTGVVMLFRRLRHLSYVSDSIDLWAKGDGLIAQLDDAAWRLHDELRGGGASASRIDGILGEIHDINSRLAPLEHQFSVLHGEASRFIKRVLRNASLLAGLALLLAGSVLVLRILKHNEQAQKQRVLQESGEQLRAVLRHAPYPIGIARASDGMLLYTNLRAREETGALAQARDARCMLDFCVNAQDWADILRSVLDEGCARNRELLIKDYDGRAFWTLTSAHPIRFKGEPCVLMNFVNIDERKRAEERLQFSASYDALTGLLNRATFGERFSQTLAQAQRHHRRMALLFMDLDGFKAVNDSFGHEVGDALLREIAARLQSCLRKGDIVGRIGGDEFVALIEEFDDPGQLAVVARKIIETTALPMAGRGEACRATASIGIALYPQDGEDVQTLLRSADRAMYQAKVQGKNRFSFRSST